MSSLLPSAEVLVEVFRFLKRVEISRIELSNSLFHALVEEHLSEYPYIRIYSIFIDLWLGGPNLQSVIGCKVQFWIYTNVNKEIWVLVISRLFLFRIRTEIFFEILIFFSTYDRTVKNIIFYYFWLKSKSNDQFDER